MIRPIQHLGLTLDIRPLARYLAKEYKSPERLESEFKTGQIGLSEQAVKDSILNAHPHITPNLKQVRSFLLNRFFQLGLPSELLFGEEIARNEGSSANYPYVYESGETARLDFPGDSFLITTDGIVFSGGMVYPMHDYDREFVAINSVFNRDHKGAFEIKHVNGFNRTVKVKFPAHVYHEGAYVDQLFELDVQLPEEPAKRKVKHLDVSIPKDSDSTIIDLRPYGLKVDSEFNPFTTKEITEPFKEQSDLFNLNGISIQPIDNGQMLRIIKRPDPFPTYEGDERKIWTTLIDRNGTNFNIELTIRLNESEKFASQERNTNIIPNYLNKRRF